MKAKEFKWRELAKADWILLPYTEKEVWYLMEHGWWRNIKKEPLDNR
jgi:hypothetical protein